MSSSRRTGTPRGRDLDRDSGGNTTVLAVVDSGLLQSLFEKGILTGSEGATLVVADIAAVRGIQGFIDSKKTEVEARPARQQHREASFGVAHGFLTSLTEEDYARMSRYQQQTGKPFRQHLKAKESGDITLFPFVEVAPGQELALRHLHGNNPGIQDAGFQLVVKVEGMGEIEDGSPFPELTNAGVVYATISDKDGSLIRYEEEILNTNALLAEAADREVTAKLQLVTEGLRELLAGIE